MEEKWKSLDFLGYPGYEVSTLGRVYKPERVDKRRNQYGINDVYYPAQVTHKPSCQLINDKGERKCYFTSKLVALAFIDNPQGCTHVGHLDGNASNNCVHNLIWMKSGQSTKKALEAKDRPKKEEWRVLPDYPDYEVSNYARLRRGDEILPVRKDGYGVSFWIIVHRGRIPVTLTVHTTVAKLFVPNPENKRFVNHKDLHLDNNYPDNLEWCDEVEYIQIIHLDQAVIEFLGEDD